MALTKDDIRLAAERPHRAEKTGRQIRQLSLEYPGITIADAYAIQKASVEPGQVVPAGSFIRPIATRKGDTIQADYGPYGSVSCYFAR
jgi:2-keto-4-pentenoate hydratase